MSLLTMIKRLVKYPFWLKAQIEGLKIGVKTMEHVLKLKTEMDTGLHFEGQLCQDLFAYLFFQGKEEGFYIDIGANNGKDISNTIIFENLGWDGICIDPLPDVFENLKKNRKCDCYNVAIADTSGQTVEFIKATGVEPLSGLKSQMNKYHKKTIRRLGGKLEKTYVKTLTFEDLMLNYPERKYIDFMSIDVEGAEIAILKTIDFNKYSFGLLTIETSPEIKRSKEVMKKYMAGKGYKVFLELLFDIMFIPESTHGT